MSWQTLTGMWKRDTKDGKKALFSAKLSGEKLEQLLTAFQDVDPNGYQITFAVFERDKKNNPQSPGTNLCVLVEEMVPENPTDEPRDDDDIPF